MFETWFENLPSDWLPSRKQYAPFPRLGDRQAWQEVQARPKEALIQQANAYLDQPWPQPLASEFLSFARSGNRLDYETPHFARRRMLTCLTLAECLEGRGRFLDKIIDGIWLCCEETFWGVSAHNGNPPYEALPDVENPYIDLFAAETGGLLALCDYLLEDVLQAQSPLIHRRIHLELKKRLIDPFLHRLDFWWMGYIREDLNNWTPWILANLLTVFLLAEDDDTRRQKGLEKMIDGLNRYLKTYDDDGGCDEGTSYWNVAGGALFDFLDQLDRATEGRVTFWDQPLIQNIGRFMARMHVDEDYFVNYADGAARINVNRSLLYRYGQKTGDEALMRLAQNLTGNARPAIRVEPLRRLLPQLFEPMPETGKDSGFPYIGDAYLDGIEVVVAREKEGSAEGLFFSAKGGHNFECHNHNDVGSCVVYLDGLPGLIDVGVETYTKKTFSDQRYEIWTMQSQHHNLPTIGGAMQQDGPDCRAQNVAHEKSNDKVIFGLDLHDAYPSQANLKRYRRTYTFRRKQEASLVIEDAYAFSDPGENIVFHFMTWKKPKLLKPGTLCIHLGKSTVLHLDYPAEKANVTIENRPTRDAKLNPVWGDDGVFRICLKHAASREGTFAVKAYRP